MSFAAVAVAGSTIIGSVISSNAASDAADAQSASAQAGINAQNERFAQIQKLLKPYTDSGTSALGKQGDFLGLNGAQPQKDVVDSIQNSPYFQAVSKQGENAILQNASATGGLRGGNTQAALAKFQPALLQSLLDQYYTRLGGLSSLGENAAAQTGNAGQNNANAVSGLYTQQGQAQAGGALAQGKAELGLINGLSSAAGTYFGNGGTLGSPSTVAPNYDGIAAAGGGIRLPGSF
jgi:hypothetical protein